MMKTIPVCYRNLEFLKKITKQKLLQLKYICFIEKPRVGGGERKRWIEQERDQHGSGSPDPEIMT